MSSQIIQILAGHCAPLGALGFAARPATGAPFRRLFGKIFFSELKYSNNAGSPPAEFHKELKYKTSNLKKNKEKREPEEYSNKKSSNDILNLGVFVLMHLIPPNSQPPNVALSVRFCTKRDAESITLK